MHKDSPFIYRRTVKFGETDAAAMVYTPRFADFCMEAAEAWFREYLDFDWFYANTVLGMGSPVVHMDIDFKAPLHGGDGLAVEIEVERVGSKSLTLYFLGRKELAGGDVTLSFTGRFVYCFTSRALGGEAIPIPDAQRAMINDYQAQCAKVI